MGIMSKGSIICDIKQVSQVFSEFKSIDMLVSKVLVFRKDFVLTIIKSRFGV